MDDDDTTASHLGRWLLHALSRLISPRSWSPRVISNIMVSAVLVGWILAYPPVYRWVGAWAVLVTGLAVCAVGAVQGWRAGLFAALLAIMAAYVLPATVGGAPPVAPTDAPAILFMTSILAAAGIMVGVISDQASRSSRELKFRANHDSVTRLPNRQVVVEELATTIALARRLGTKVSVLAFDLDRFGEVNQTLGRAAGDALLREVALRLAGLAGARETLGRIGSDEFAMILPGAERAEAQEMASRALRELGAPVDIGGQLIECGCAIGLAIYPDNGRDPETLLLDASIAVDHAKRAGSGIFIYNQELGRGKSELALLTDLRDAVEQGQLVLLYQPQVNLKTGQAVGLEGLVRWQHPEYGLLRPSAFMPLAERSGLVHPLFAWILNTALDHCQHWLRSGLEVPVVVNLSIRNLLDPDLPRVVERMLEDRGMDPRWLMLDANESDVMTDPTQVKTNVADLIRLGVRFSIDSFGTGYSSLAQLNHLPLTAVKIDSSFVSKMAGNWSSEAIVRSMVGLIHDLGFQVMAVGVEDLPSWRLLAELGCDAAQGFYIKGPTGVQALQEWVMACMRQTESPLNSQIAPPGELGRTIREKKPLRVGAS